jgi:hypothetical protein
MCGMCSYRAGSPAPLAGSKSTQPRAGRIDLDPGVRVVADGIAVVVVRDTARLETLGVSGVPGRLLRHLRRSPERSAINLMGASVAS